MSEHKNKAIENKIDNYLEEVEKIRKGEIPKKSARKFLEEMRTANQEILEDIKNRCEHDCYMDNKRSLSVSLSDILWLIDQTEKKQELEDLINTHEPHGRNYTNEQYVNLRSQVSELNKAHHLKDMEHDGLVRQLKEKDGLIKKYINAYSRIEQVYRANYKQYTDEYDGGYLDGLDTALGILEEVEE